MKDPNLPKILAIVVTYNGSKWIEKCFGSLIKSSIDLHIIAIDNCSSDGTPDLIQQKYPQVELIKTGANIGFGRANNIGLKIAIETKVDYVFLLNQDAWIESSTIKILIENHKLAPEYGILSPMHINPHNNEFEYYFKGYLSEVNTPSLISDSLLHKEIKNIYQTKFVNAAAWLMSASCLKSVGGFDPIFFMYGEDDDYIMRTIFHNYKIGISPYAKIYHDSNTPNCNKKNTNKSLAYNIKELKNLNNSYKSLLFHLIKSSIDDITTLFFTRRLKDSFYNFKILLLTIGKLYSIYLSRKKSIYDQTTFLK